ncbi:MAG: hypothetical protein JNN22_08840 [Rhodospirillales bacterium]|nr:hypothetical protein [Rhodospirillales bacterium]
MLAGDKAGMPIIRKIRKLRSDEEPRLSEILDDPVIHAVMARDRITREDLLAQIAAVRERLAAAP